MQENWHRFVTRGRDQAENVALYFSPLGHWDKEIDVSWRRGTGFVDNQQMLILTARFTQ